MTAPDGWGELVAPRDVHNPPSEVAGAQLPSQSQLLEWGRNLIEGIVKEVVRLVTGVLLPGPAGQQLADWATGLIDDFDKVFGAFDGIDITNPGAVLQAIFDAIGDALEDIPIVGDLIDTLMHGMGYSGAGFSLTNLFNGFNAVLPKMSGGKLSAFNLPDITKSMSSDLQATIDQVFNAWDSGISGNTSGNPISNLFNAIFGVNRTGTGAQSQNVVQDSQIGSLLSGGAGLFDTFDGSSATSLPSGNWEQTYFGSGGGTSGLSGSGAATWRTSGASDRGCLNRYKTALSSDTQLVSVTLGSNLPLSTIADDPEIRIQGRMDSTRQNYVEARMNYGQAEIGIVVGGSYTRLGANQSISGDSSGTWSLKLGTVSSSREFVLLLNNVTVMTRSDGGGTSVIDAANRYGGFTQVAGVQYLGGILFFQQAPPDVQSWAASDRLAAL